LADWAWKAKVSVASFTAVVIMGVADLVRVFTLPFMSKTRNLNHHSCLKEKAMTKNTVSIELDRETLARLLGNHPVATGVHCGDDGGDVDGFCGAIALGAHCGDDIDG
jgi:hypothetical protein